MDISTVLQLDEPLPAGGIRAVNFFNGRLLASGDLSREQEARREGDRRLGLVLGDGVAAGLDVSLNGTLSAPGLPVAHVSAGLAVNRLGQTIRVTADVDVALARRFDPTAAAGGSFGACAPLVGGSYVAGAGVYILTVAPAAATEGRAATNGLDPANVRCNTDATVEAVAFRLLTVRPDLFAGLPLGAGFRNALAYRCFGPGVLPDWLGRLFNASDRNGGLLAQLRPAVLTDAEVPVAVLFFTGAATLQFIDAWSVRREAAPTPASFPPAALADRGREAIGRAMFLQFQAQIADLALPAGGLGTLRALDQFSYLPPVGIVPVATETDATDMQATAFFAGMTYRNPVFMNAGAIEPLLRESLSYPPIDTQGGEFVSLYRVRENSAAMDAGSRPGAPAPRGYIVFASGQLPYCGDAQFDLSSSNYANIARAG